MEQLEHENVVGFLGATETENHIHLILEYVDSGPLSALIAKYGNLSEKLCSVYLKQVLEGLKVYCDCHLDCYSLSFLIVIFDCHF